MSEELKKRIEVLEKTMQRVKHLSIMANLHNLEEEQKTLDSGTTEISSEYYNKAWNEITELMKSDKVEMDNRIRELNKKWELEDKEYQFQQEKGEIKQEGKTC